MEKLNEQFQRIEAKLRELNTKTSTNAELMEDVSPALVRIEDGIVALLVLLEKVIDRFAMMQNLGVTMTVHNESGARQGGVDVKDSVVKAQEIVGGDVKKVVVIEGTLEEKKE